MDPPKRIVLARLGAAHGIKGEIRIRVFADDPASVRVYGPLESGDGRKFEIAGLRRQGEGLVARIAGIDDRTAAEALAGLELGVPRDRLPPADDDEHYHADLIGLRAETIAGTLLGTVVALQNFGAGDLLEIAPPRGVSLLVPFTKAVVPVIDLAAGRVVIDAPAGLLDNGESVADAAPALRAGESPTPGSAADEATPAPRSALPPSRRPAGRPTRR